MIGTYFDACGRGVRCPGSVDKLERREDNTKEIIRRRYYAQTFEEGVRERVHRCRRPRLSRVHTPNDTVSPVAPLLPLQYMLGVIRT